MDLSIEKGQIFGLLGPNGSGKSTFLGIVLGLIRPSSGRYAWFGQGAKDSLRKQVGSLLERPNFSPWLSGVGNLQVAAAIKGIAHPNEAIRKALTQVGLQAVGGKNFAGYSLGMKQRLAIASCLLGSPEVLVLDEPTNGIDASGIVEIRQTILDLAKQGKTVILASHVLDEVEKLCTHVAILRRGQIIESGAIRQVLQSAEGIEVSAENLDELENALASSQLVKNIKRSEKGILVELKEHQTPAMLNRSMAEQGIFLERLVERKKTLEAHFLQSLEA